MLFSFCCYFTSVSIVMSMSVCPWGCLRNHTRDLYQYFSACCSMAVVRSCSGRAMKSQEKGAILGGCLSHSKALAVFAAAVAAKGIIQSPVTSCSRRDHSVCQASTNRNPENYVRKQCGLSARKEVTGVHSAGEVWYLRLPCLMMHSVVQENVQNNEKKMLFRGCKSVGPVWLNRLNASKSDRAQRLWIPDSAFFTMKVQMMTVNLRQSATEVMCSEQTNRGRRLQISG